MEYTKLPGLIPDRTTYWNEEMGTMEAVLPPGGYKTVHGLGLLELENKDLLCVWFAGSSEGNVGVNVIRMRFKKGSSRWEKPVLVFHDPNRSEQNPLLSAGPDREMWVVYTSQPSRMEDKDSMQFTSVTRCQKSADREGAWSDYETMFPKEGSFCRQPIQVLGSGRWIFGNWIYTDSELGLASDPTAFHISDDQEKTQKTVDMPENNGAAHTNTVELEPGHLATFVRSHAADHIYQSEPMDNGDTRTAPVPTVLPNNNSNISAVKLRSGKIAIAYSPICIPCLTPGVASWPGLCYLVAVALFKDGGLTFPMIRYMERSKGYMDAENKTNNKRYEYLYIMQGADGRLHLASAYKNRLGVKYMSLTEEDAMGKKRETVGLYSPTSAGVR